MAQKLFKRSMHKWAVINGTMVSFTSHGAINNDVWAAFIKELKSSGATGWLSTTEGYVEANSVQRKMATDVTSARGMQVAVVTDERLVRGMVTAASWLGVKIKAFSFDELEAATSYLGVNSLAKTELIRKVNEFKTECEEQDDHAVARAR